MPGSMKFDSGSKHEDKSECIFLSEIFLEFLVNAMKVDREGFHVELLVAEGNLLPNRFMLLNQLHPGSSGRGCIFLFDGYVPFHHN